MVPLIVNHDLEGSPMCAIQKFTTLMAPSTVWYINMVSRDGQCQKAVLLHDKKILGLFDKDKSFNLSY
jgi:hypothetical protein